MAYIKTSDKIKNRRWDGNKIQQIGINPAILTYCWLTRPAVSHHWLAVMTLHAGTESKQYHG